MEPMDSPLPEATPSASFMHRAKRALVGQVDWQPPAWVRWLRAHRGPVAATLVALALIAYGIFWWVNRPAPIVPNAVSVTLSAPRSSDYTVEAITIPPLRLNFSGSAAPLEHIGKAAVGIRLEPSIAGSWSWEDDHTVVFMPASDWPIAQAYEVHIDPKIAMAPDVPLAPGDLEFTLPVFSASWQSQEFYQDPQDANLKKAVWALSFSHPVDTAKFEGAISARMFDGAGRVLPSPKLSVQYDEHKLKAWVHSEPLALPPNGGMAHLDVPPSVVSSLGGPPIAGAMSETVTLPALYSVRVNELTPTLVDNDRFEPEQVLILAFNLAMKDRDVQANTRAWLLPERNLAIPKEQQSTPYAWSESEIDEKLLRQSEAVKLEPITAEREFIEVHSFKYTAPVGRHLYVRVDKGLKSFGGFILGKPYTSVFAVPEYPRLLKFVGQGSLLSLRGERRVTVVSRNLPAMRLEIGRVLPTQLHHLVQFNQGDFSSPQVWDIGEDSLVDRVEKRVSLPTNSPSESHYQGIDLGEFFSAERHGVFLLSLRTLSDSEAQSAPETTIADDAGEVMDTRLVVLTDLGVVAKKNLDSSREIFVQSLHSGTAVVGARVAVIARNGETLAAAETDAQGHASLPSLDAFRREKHPTMIAVSLGEDASFLPLNNEGHALDLSRFDIGGESNELDGGTLKATLFSDRGLYRPGDTINLGYIVRAADWQQSLAGIPLHLEIVDSRGSVVQSKRLSLNASGFDGYSLTPTEGAPSGTWTATLSLVRDKATLVPLGETTVQVREFLPDTLRARATLSAQRAEGWVRPDGLKAHVDVENLFGTPAQSRRVEASVVLRPAFPSFLSWPNWNFYDPLRATEGFNEPLSEGTTDADGKAEFDLGLSQYERATYQLSFLARAFEPGSGRNVAAQVSTLVSANDYLVGIRTVDELSYVKRGATRAIDIVSIGDDAKAKAVDGLHVVVIERRFVSILTKEDSGLYKYVSQERKIPVSDTPLPAKAGEQKITLKTDLPGEFIVEIRDAAGELVNQTSYSVAGQANVQRSLERNAELALSLSQADYRAGEEIEISVRAPYVGSGLITIEREKVYAHAWFRADTTSSVQRIRIPADFEGSGYVNVQFVRDPESDEVYMSPLSYAVAPFSVDRGARTLPVSIKIPPVSKPGAEIDLQVTTDGPARVIAFAVDEGILQVARYQLGNPLDHFFKKKMLQVETAQILDLILPEFSRLLAASAPGGDGEGDMAKHLNPFKRKSERPAVWWSGATDIDGEHTFKFSMPDHFNGQIRVMVVAVSPARIGVKETKALIRGDFVLTPTVPTHVAPGDEFELPVGIANTIDGGGSEAVPVSLRVQLPKGLTQVSAAPTPLMLKTGSEGKTSVRLKAGDTLGALSIVLIAESGQRNVSRRIELSLRPSIVARQDLRIGRADRRTELKDLRNMYAERATRQLSASTSPFVAAEGLAAYLGDFPHRCTEQLLSQSIPALVYAARPEFGRVHGADTGALLAELRARQNAQGGFGLWIATPDADAFVSAYAMFYLIEARERGESVPADLLQAGNRYLAAMAADAALTQLYQLRARAFATYLLIRQGQTATHLLSAVHEQLKRDYPKTWEGDTTAMFLAASYQLLKQAAPARELIRKPLLRVSAEAATPYNGYANFSDANIESAWTVYLAQKHFPAAAERISVGAIEHLLAPIKDNTYNTLSSALVVLALEAYGDAKAVKGLPSLSAARGNGPERAFGKAFGQLVRGNYLSTDERLMVQPPTATPSWFVLAQSGYDRVPPQQVQNQGLEVLREYLDAQGHVLKSAQLGQEITVRLRLRALDAQVRGEIAVVDLLPGGFEPVVQMPPPAPDADDEGSNEDGMPTPVIPTLALPGTTLATQHIEQREDRVVLYATANAGVAEFLYKIRPSNPGTFVIPPTYAESMYERKVYAQGGPAGSIDVSAEPAAAPSP